MSQTRHTANCLSVRNGHLFIEDVDTVDLAAEFGTPIFVYSERQLRSNYRRFRDAFSSGWDGPVDVLPAMKANTLLATRQILTDEGAGADIYSPGELEGALSTGVDARRVSVTGGGKSDDVVRRCVEAGVRITVEDIDEVDRISRIAAELDRTASIRFRVKPSVPNLWRRTDFSQLSVPTDIAAQVYKSGIPTEYLVDMGRKALSSPHINLVGVHFHAGRHQARLSYWKGLMTRYAKLIGDLSRAWDGWRPSEIDIGGGMASPQDPSNRETPRSEFVLTAATYPLLVALRWFGERAYHAIIGKVVPTLTGGPRPKRTPTIEQYAEVITRTLGRELTKAGVDPRGIRLQMEPGRGLYGDTGIHLTTVKVVKRQHEPIPYSWVLTDTTYFFFSDTVIEHNRYPFVVANKADDPAEFRADIVGHSCAPDMIVMGASLPETAQGDLVALLEIGAYGETSASNFNALPRPAAVLVHGHDAELIKKAETMDDIYRRDIVPDRLKPTQIEIDLTETRVIPES
jgi:diaminopimelate decarboxylase